MSEQISEFVGSRGWFATKYACLDSRFQTMHAALNLFLQRRGQTIVETGCARLPDDWGGGMSSLVFSDVVDRFGGHLYSIDIEPVNVAFCHELTMPYSGSRSCIASDSVAWLQSNERQIDLLYLDSCDYPYGQLLELYGGRTDIEKATAELWKLSDEEVLDRHGSIVALAQQHCLAELMAAQPQLHSKSVVLIDDNNFPGGGKSRLAKKALWQAGWCCLLDYQQTLWVQPCP